MTFHVTNFSTACPTQFTTPPPTHLIFKPLADQLHRPLTALSVETPIFPPILQLDKLLAKDCNEVLTASCHFGNTSSSMWWPTI